MKSPWMQRLAGLGQGVLRVLVTFTSMQTEFTQWKNQMDQTVTAIRAELDKVKTDITTLAGVVTDTRAKLVAALGAQTASMDPATETALQGILSDLQGVDGAILSTATDPAAPTAP